MQRSVNRVMGSESEFGIMTPGRAIPPAVASGWVVRAADPGRPVPWDYLGERPLLDQWGFLAARDHADPSQLTDDPTVANRVLANGARLYVDHAHPEYSSPEVTTPLEIVRYDRAGDEVARDAMAALAARGEQVLLYKNNTDGKGASYGTHENYLMSRHVPFGDVMTGLLPFFASRIVTCGAGRVGIGRHSEKPGFQVSSRADFFEKPMSLETTMRRGMVNTRDEPHATPELYRRLHVIVGDANLTDVSLLLRFGTTSLVLGMMEEGALDLGLILADPVAAFHTFSHDPDLRAVVVDTQGRSWTAVSLQQHYLDSARRWLAEGGQPVDDDTAQVLNLWQQVLDALSADQSRVAHLVEWVAKRTLMEGWRQRVGAGWDHPQLAAMDLQWADLRPERSLVDRLIAHGRVARLVGDEQVRAAVTTAPETTRAWLRGELARRWGDQIFAANWAAVHFGRPGEAGAVRFPMAEPRGGRREDLEHVLAQCETPADLALALHQSGADAQPTV